MTDRWRVSTSGGSGPRWSANGDELYYVNEASEIVAVPVQRIDGNESFRFGQPEILFKALMKPLSRRQFDTIDGQSFVLNRRVADADPTPLTMVLNAF